MKKSAKSSAEGEKFINFINILESLCGSAAFLIGSTVMKQPAWRRTGASRAGSSLQVSLPDGGFGGCVNHGIWRSSEDAVS